MIPRTGRGSGVGPLVRSLLLALVLCPSQGAAQGFDHDRLARTFLDRHISPGYQRLTDAARALDGRARAFCEAGPGADMAPLRAAFGDVALAWAGIEHLQFGPVMAERRHARMLYWPDRKGIGRKQVARAIRKRDPSVTDPTSLARKSVALQGLGAVEQLIHGSGAAGFDAPGAARAHRCGYLTAAAANLAGIAGNILSGWTSPSGFRKTLLEPGPGNAVYIDASEVTLEIVKSFVLGLERVRDARIAGPLGLDRSRGRPAFMLSRLSTRAITANIEGLRHAYATGGLMDAITEPAAGIERSILFDLDQALGHLRAVDLPISEAADDPDAEDRLIAAGYPLKNARQQFIAVLSQAAGISLGLNTTDGD